MDPDLALNHILRGYMIAEHAAALQGWLARGGFAPMVRPLPDDCASFVADHCARHYGGLPLAQVLARATKDGIWTMPPNGQWISLAIWLDLRRAID
jgi:hypothetical protein